MAKRFLASQPGSQDPETFRQFRDIEAYLLELEARLSPLFGSAVIDPTGILDPVIWTEFTLSENELPEEDGVYWGSLRLVATGSNANATIQLRVTWGGIDGVPPGERIGDVLDIGNHTRISVTLSGTIAIGINMKWYARGQNSQIDDGRISITRTGTGDVIRGQT